MMPPGRVVGALAALAVGITGLTGCGLLGQDGSTTVDPADEVPTTRLEGPIADVGEFPAIDGEYRIRVDSVEGAVDESGSSQMATPDATMFMFFPTATLEDYRAFLAESAALGYEATTWTEGEGADDADARHDGWLRQDGADVLHVSFTPAGGADPDATGIVLGVSRDEPFPFPEAASIGLEPFHASIPGGAVDPAGVAYDTDVPLVSEASPAFRASVGERAAWHYSMFDFTADDLDAFDAYADHVEAAGFTVDRLPRDDGRTASFTAVHVDGRAQIVHCQSSTGGTETSGCEVVSWEATT